MIIQALYAVRPAFNRHGEALFLEGVLDKWYLELPEYLRHEPGSKQPVHLPHVLVIHMQYWCAVLLLHRPLCVPTFSYAILLQLTSRHSIRIAEAKGKRYVI